MSKIHQQYAKTGIPAQKKEARKKPPKNEAVTQESLFGGSVCKPNNTSSVKPPEKAASSSSFGESIFGSANRFLGNVGANNDAYEKTHGAESESWAVESMNAMDRERTTAAGNKVGSASQFDAFIGNKDNYDNSSKEGSNDPTFTYAKKPSKDVTIEGQLKQFGKDYTKLYDEDGNGTISSEEFLKKDKKTDNAFKDIDINKDKKIDAKEMTSLIALMDTQDSKEGIADGKISYSNFKTISSKLGDSKENLGETLKNFQEKIFSNNSDSVKKSDGLKSGKNTSGGLNPQLESKLTNLGIPENIVQDPFAVRDYAKKHHISLQGIQPQ